MLPAVYILVFAWLLTGIIGSLGTGQYLATLVEGVVSPTWLPMLLFVLSGLMAFATGTSWGTFGIMLPIAGDMAAATELAMMLPMMGRCWPAPCSGITARRFPTPPSCPRRVPAAITSIT